jgi:hypothetical protein
MLTFTAKLSDFREVMAKYDGIAPETDDVEVLSLIMAYTMNIYVIPSIVISLYHTAKLL